MDLNSIVKYTHSLKVLYIEDDNSRESTIELFSQIFHLVVSAVDGIDGLNQYIKYHQENEKYIKLRELGGESNVKRIKKELNEEISYYPSPIAGCDVQFDWL